MTQSRLGPRLDDCESSYGDGNLNDPGVRFDVGRTGIFGSHMTNVTLSQAPRRTPRVSLIVIVPENHVVSPECLADRLPAGYDHEVDVIVACAGQPVDLNSLQRAARRVQFLVAPAGTSSEDLRELAMRRAPGDIVTLVTGQLRHAIPSAERELLTTSKAS